MHNIIHHNRCTHDRCALDRKPKQGSEDSAKTLRITAKATAMLGSYHGSDSYRVRHSPSSAEPQIAQ